MPEGPEVKLITNYLSKKLVGKYIFSIEILSGRYLNHDVPKNYNKFIKLLPIKIKSINAYGKFIWWEFENTELTLWNTLGMSGWWQIKKEIHNNIKITYNTNIKSTDKLRHVFFNDPRNFGTLIFDSKNNLKIKLDKFGPDILSQNPKYKNIFIELVKKKKISICEVLLDQKIAAGCGNYLRAETLYLAEINPFIKANTLSTDKLLELWSILHQLAWYFYNKKKALELKILTNNYKMPDAFDRVFLIYSQKIDPLGNKVRTDLVKMRTIHWVPTIQN